MILSEKVPNGLCCHAYSGRFGTLWSMRFNVMEARLMVCFGSPQTGTWFEADLQAEPGIEVVEVTYEDEQVLDSFWADH